MLNVLNHKPLSKAQFMCLELHDGCVHVYYDKGRTKEHEQGGERKVNSAPQVMFPNPRSTW